MAYNRTNYLKTVNYIVDIYNKAKERDKPDTQILRYVFPQHGIYISYRQWMNIKSMKPSEYRQATLF